MDESLMRAPGAPVTLRTSNSAPKGELKTEGKGRMNILQYPLNLTVSMATGLANKVKEVLGGAGQVLCWLARNSTHQQLLALFSINKVSQGLKPLNASYLFHLLELTRAGRDRGGMECGLLSAPFLMWTVRHDI